MNEYKPREETRAYQNDRENQSRDMAQWPCNHLSILDAARICCPDPALVAKLERAHKIDRLKAELRQKAEELRALADSPNEPMTDAELDAMLDRMNREYWAVHLHELTTERRAFTPKLNPHDE